MMRLIVLTLCLLAAPALAQTAEKAPVEIEASKQLEWLRDRNLYRATGDVMIKQGPTTITGDNAEAAYDPAIGTSALTVITVTGHVVIKDGDRNIIGDKAVYDTATQNLTVSDNGLRLTVPQMVVTARDTIQYDAKNHIATATGDAEVVSNANGKTQTVNADKIVATLDPATNKLTTSTATGHARLADGVQRLNADTVAATLDGTGAALDHATATGHVMMTKAGETGTDIATADRADYDATKKIVTLTGTVKITRGTDHMQGDKAVLDLASGHSALSNLPDAQGNTGRVRAIFATGGTSAPKLGAAMPMIDSKKAFEPAYAVGVREVKQNDR